MRILASEAEVDDGVITRRRDLVTGYLPQAFELDSNITVLEAARDGARHVLSSFMSLRTFRVILVGMTIWKSVFSNWRAGRSIRGFARPSIS